MVDGMIDRFVPHPMERRVNGILQISGRMQPAGLIRIFANER